MVEREVIDRRSCTGADVDELVRRTAEAASAYMPDQDWSLRVTLAFRREGAEWALRRRG
jgi:hypothetical protein